MLYLLENVLSFLFKPTSSPNISVDRTALYTVGLIAVAYYQLSNIQKTSRADFVKKFSDDFFTKDTRNLITLLMNSAMEFEVLTICTSYDTDRLPYLKLRVDIIEQLRKGGIISLEDGRLGYNAFEIDDLILGHMEDVGRYERNGLIDFEGAYETFSYYFKELLAEKAPLKCILEDKDNKGAYNNLKYMKKEFELYDAMKDRCLIVRLYWYVGHWCRRKCAR